MTSQQAVETIIKIFKGRKGLLEGWSDIDESDRAEIEAEILTTIRAVDDPCVGGSY